MLWFFDSSRQALVHFDPVTGKGVGFLVPDIERADFWEPKGKLEVGLRTVLPRPPGQASQIQAAPPGLASRLKHGH